MKDRRSSTQMAAATRASNLNGVTVFAFDIDGRFKQRIEARAAVLIPGVWVLRDARVYGLGAMPVNQPEYRLKTSLTPEQVRESFATPETVPFWELPVYITIAEHAGLVAAGYRLQFQRLIARPFLLVAMVFLAAAVSLRFFRFGGVQKMVLSGVAAGFSALRFVQSDRGFKQGRADAPGGSSLAARARRRPDGIYRVVVPGGRVMAGRFSARPPARRRLKCRAHLTVLAVAPRPVGAFDGLRRAASRRN